MASARVSDRVHSMYPPEPATPRIQTAHPSSPPEESLQVWYDQVENTVNISVELFFNFLINIQDLPRGVIPMEAMGLLAARGGELAPFIIVQQNFP